MDELFSLEMLDSIVWSNTRNALTAIATKHFLNWQFYGRGETEMKAIFKTNVANNIIYARNEALINSSVVDTYEHVIGHNSRYTPKIESDDLVELRKHRIVLSRPAQVEYSDPKVQEFYQGRNHYKDNKAVRLWRIRQSIIEKIEERGGSAKFPLEVTIQSGTIETIQ